MNDIERISEIKAGDEVTNICTSESNPMHHCFFVAHVTRARTHHKIKHVQHFARVIDRKGHAGNYGLEVIYKGRLKQDECDGLFAPVLEKEYGRKVPQMTEVERVNAMIKRNPDWMTRPGHRRVIDRLMKRAIRMDGESGTENAATGTTQRNLTPLLAKLALGQGAG